MSDNGICQQGDVARDGPVMKVLTVGDHVTVREGVRRLLAPFLEKPRAEATSCEVAQYSEAFPKSDDPPGGRLPVDKTRHSSGISRFGPFILPESLTARPGPKSKPVSPCLERSDAARV